MSGLGDQRSIKVAAIDDYKTYINSKNKEQKELKEDGNRKHESKQTKDED